jgi:hypothetical protein
MSTRFPSVPLADDPELTEHALWNDEIAADLKWQVEALHPYLRGELTELDPPVSPSAVPFTEGEAS